MQQVGDAHKDLCKSAFVAIRKRSEALKYSIEDWLNYSTSMYLTAFKNRIINSLRKIIQ